jgi:hypothetical protein
MKKDKSKSALLVISMGFLFLFLVFKWKWAVYTSFGTGVIGLISERLSSIIEKGWMKMSDLLGKIVPSILLGLVFYLFLFPLSLLSKLFTKDPLMLSSRYKTYYTEVKEKVTKKSFENTW